MQEVIQAGGQHLQLVPEGARQLRARFPDDVALPVTLVQLLLGINPPADSADGGANAAAAHAADDVAVALLHDEGLIKQLMQVRTGLTCLGPEGPCGVRG